MKRVIEATLAGLIALSFAIPTAPNVPDRGKLQTFKAKSERTAASVKRDQTHENAPNFDLDDLIDYLTADFKNAAERAINGRRSYADTASEASNGGGAILASEPIPEADTSTVDEPEPEFVEDSGTTEAYEPDLTYAGEWVVTFYCDCAQCVGQYAGMMMTASGNVPQAGWTVAAGPSYPFGTILEIEGFGMYEVQDRGVSDGCVDIYVNDHSEIPSYGMTTTSVYLIN